MFKTLFLPLFQLPTGHHRVADALMHSLNRHLPAVQTKKIDFLSYCGPHLEKLVTYLYLKWIDRAPKSYHLVYRNTMYPSSRHYFQLYEDLFLRKMHKLVKQERPDLIVCTQAFPSFLLQCLKQEHLLDVPVINVYTDFFINNLWGKQWIDFHFVPDTSLKAELLRQGLSPGQVTVTGIPIDEGFRFKAQNKSRTPSHILIAGGSSGLGGISRLLKMISETSPFHFSILCGTNESLYKEIALWRHPKVTPLPYISSREQMNILYDGIDALITKPGGVTISEALAKRIPVFIHSELPGQETLNREFLTQHTLVFNLDTQISLDAQLTSTINDRRRMAAWEKAVESYVGRFDSSAHQKLRQIIGDLQTGHYCSPHRLENLADPVSAQL